jgi:hypothetical protein
MAEQAYRVLESWAQIRDHAPMAQSTKPGWRRGSSRLGASPATSAALTSPT